MSNSSAQRRRLQFSSCDACRRSRVACDASSFGYQPGNLGWHGSCSRCARRKRSCTFDWINRLDDKPSKSRSRTPLDLPAIDNTGKTNGIENLLEPAADDSLGLRWTSQIFLQGFETSFGFLVGKDSCPFIDDPHSDTYIAATKIFRMIDNYIEEEITDQRFSLNTSLQAERRKRNSQLENSLEITINAYKAQWHPLVPRGQEQNGKLVEEVIRNNWRAARREMLKVINRASYRSVLALYLFSQTPVPIGVSDEEEGDGVSGLVCIQTALLQIQRLRERQKGGQFYGSGTLAWTETLAGSMSGSHLSRAYLDLENRAYWATVIWDTSSSLTSNLRASLTSGLKGACSEPVWRLTRSFLTGSFHHKTEAWRTKGFEVSDDTASQVISAAAICTLYIWKNITSLKEALREGVDEESVLFTWTALQDAIDIFKSSIRPLLTLCERQLHFLGQDLRFIWYQVHLQYCLGILIMADAIEGARRSDLLSEVREAVQDAENEAFDVLKSGTDSDFKIDLPGEPLSTITASLVAMDPNPHYVLDLVSLLNKSIISKHRRGEIKPPIYSYLHSILYKALDQLPRYSKSVSGARDSLQRAFGREKQFPSSGTTV